MVGTTLNHYQIIRVIGSGGMGEVLLATDTRLKRQVAIKVLPTHLAAQPVRRDQFEREAQAVAALNHPNIVTIYSVEQAGDTDFLTMEYVEGRTLADVLPKGGLPIVRLLTIARQIVDAVVAAHDRHIVHRDLKPANVMVAASDRVKVLDFGLARLCEETDHGIAATLTTRELTGEGKIVGTVAYMSPEQAEGKPVDERSDIFSLGVTLYELATGERPFTGDTSLSVLSAILKDTPKSLSELNPAAPRELERIVRHALVKDPDRRYQSAKDLRHDLEELAQAIESGELNAQPQVLAARRNRRVIAAGLAAVAAVSAIGVWRQRTPAAAPAETPLSPTYSRLTHMEGVERYPSLSPDGKWVVYSSSGDIHLQSTTGQTVINLTKDALADNRMPAFSPDGESIAFRSERDGGGIFVMGRTGESVRRLTAEGYDPGWFPDSRQVVFASAGPGGPENRTVFSDLWVVSTSGGQPRPFFAGDAVQPSVSPHGKRVAYWSVPADASAKRMGGSNVGANRDVWTIDTKGGQPVRVTTHLANDWNPIWSPDGRWLYFLSNRAGSMNLWRIAIDEASGAITGEAQPLTAPAAYVADFKMSADGSIAVYSSVLATSNISRIGFDAKSGATRGAVTTVTTGANDFTWFDVTHDGQSVVVGNSSRGQEDLYILPAAGGEKRQITNDPARDRIPHWSPDRRHILFYSDRVTNPNVWLIDADGSGLQQLTQTISMGYPVPSPDGKRVVTAASNARQMFIYDARDFSKPIDTLPRFPDTTVSFPRPSDWSDDGRKIAIDLPGSDGVWFYSVEARTYHRVASAATSEAPSPSPRWLSDSRRFVYSSLGRLWLADTVSGQTRELVSFQGETLSNPVITTRDSQLFFSHGTTTGDIWLMRFGDTKK
jgi:eukaryotic-like serine/threonine-protein kinase